MSAAAFGPDDKYEASVHIHFSVRNRSDADTRHALIRELAKLYSVRDAGTGGKLDRQMRQTHASHSLWFKKKIEAFDFRDRIGLMMRTRRWDHTIEVMDEPPRRASLIPRAPWWMRVRGWFRRHIGF